MQIAQTGGKKAPTERLPYASMQLQGSGFIQDAYNYLSDGVKKLRKHKTISKIGKSVGSWGIPVVSDIAGTIGQTAEMFGFGKQMGGRGVNDLPS